MTEEDQIEMIRKLDKLRMEHRRLDEEIFALTKGNRSGEDEFSVFRLKKEKLRLRDQINALEHVIYPDIIA